eukprot:gnl/Trimastix_PCT/1696.p1 GENE.gnl/Trimastix_PCT/1696~~gnl/Trimastix_PCT/1696.p1  ORF type:complete len:397 (+),score=56.95 gnl/Trimastix_PCT/1696:159-1193(+)
MAEQTQSLSEDIAAMIAHAEQAVAEQNARLVQDQRAHEEQQRQLVETTRQEVAAIRVDFDREREAFEARQRQLEEMHAIPEDVIELDVRGTIFRTKKATLCKQPDSFLAAMFSGTHPMTRDREGRIFIEANPRVFELILDFLSYDEMPVGFRSPHEEQIFLSEFQRLQLKVPSLFVGSIVPPDAFPALAEWVPRHYTRAELLYKATRDGFMTATFHTKCNNQGTTLTLIQSTNGNLFGGYTPIPWTSDGQYHVDTATFIFSLRRDGQVRPFRCLQHSGQCHVHHGSDRIAFGLGHDIYVADNANQNRSSHVIVGGTFTLSNGENPHLAGKKNFKAAEIEVYKLT